MAKPKLSAKDYMEIRRHRWRFHDRMVPWYGGCLAILAFTLPIWGLGHWIHDLAGKKTTVGVSVTISVVLNVALGVTIAVQNRRRHAQTKTIEQLRGRLSVYEDAALAEQGIARKHKAKEAGKK